MKEKFIKLLKKNKEFCVVAACVAVITIIVVCCVVHSKKEKEVFAALPTTESISKTEAEIETTTEAEIETTTEAEIISTTKSTNKVATTVKTDTKNNSPATITTKKAENNKPLINPVSFFVDGPTPCPSGPGLALSNLGANNFRDDPDGGYLFDIYGTILNKEYPYPTTSHPITGSVCFSVSTMDGTPITYGELNVGELQPGESKQGKKSVHVNDKTTYHVHFYTSSWN